MPRKQAGQDRCDPAAPPGQQEVHGMNRRKCNVKGIELCRRGESTVGNQLRSKGFDLGVNDQFGYATQGIQTALRRRGVSLAGFRHDDFRRVHV
jgi:hypothetical protein